jgi:hypothetical protein
MSICDSPGSLAVEQSGEPPNLEPLISKFDRVSVIISDYKRTYRDFEDREDALVSPAKVVMIERVEKDTDDT